MFGQLVLLGLDRSERWTWADPVVFWGVNLGLVVFLVGLITEQAVIKQIGSPVMGVAILLGLLVFAMRLRESDLSGALES